MGWGCPLLGFYCRVRSRSYQGHFKVKPAIILNKNIFVQFPYVFSCKRVFHKAAVDIYCGWEAFQPVSQGVQWLYVAWRGNTPLLYHPSPHISHPLPALTSVKNKVNWSLVEHGLQVTKHLKHPHLGNKGVMVWGCLLLGFYSRVRTRSYKRHFKGKADKLGLLNRNTFYSMDHVFPVIGGHIVLDL